MTSRTSSKLALFCIELSAVHACSGARAGTVRPNFTSTVASAAAESTPSVREVSGGGGAGSGAGPGAAAGRSDAASSADMPAATPPIAGSSATQAGTAAGASGNVDANPRSGASGGGSGHASAAGGAAMSGSAAAPTHWLATWTASPYPAAADAQPPGSLSQAVLRQVVHISVGGEEMRVLFSNLSGDGPVTLESVHVARCNAAPAVDSSIEVGSDVGLSFDGKPSVTIGPGSEVWSDPVRLRVAPLGNVSITTAFGNVPDRLTAHAGSRTTSYLQTGSAEVSAADMASAKSTDHWYFIAGVDVKADASFRAIAVIGDSITDGRGTDTNKNNRWTDILAARLQADSRTANVSVLNQGIGGTTLVGAGTAAEARFSRDVLRQSGVRYAIVFDGVNDIGAGTTFESMKRVYEKLIEAAHAQQLRIYGSTILPFAGNGYYSAEHEGVRQQVNSYIRSGAFDGFIDFDAALSDAGNPPALQPGYAAWAQKDGLHPGPAGYRKMAETVDLALFTK